MNNNAKKTNAAKTKVEGPRGSKDKLDCRLKLYKEYRQQCSDNIDSCPLIQECGKYGVGSPEWPVTSYMPPNLASARDATDVVREGMSCATRVIWTEPNYRPLLDKCGGKPPGFLNPQPKDPRQVVGQQVRASAKKATTSSTTKGTTTRATKGTTTRATKGTTTRDTNGTTTKKATKVTTTKKAK